ncbi:MAG: hypothetical protein GXP46_05670 [Deferribacteres bacterium]|nr:hypothetical protein [Deferribacteres bacterium]
MINLISEVSAPQPGGADRSTEYRKVAREMESLFAYQLIKVMRETAESMSSEKKGPGYDTYMSLFDMEVSRLLAERGLGLSDAIVRWMQRMPEINRAATEED